MTMVPPDELEVSVDAVETEAEFPVEDEDGAELPAGADELEVVVSSADLQPAKANRRESEEKAAPRTRMRREMWAEFIKEAPRFAHGNCDCG